MYRVFGIKTNEDMVEKKSFLMGMVITMTLPISLYQRPGDILLYKTLNESRVKIDVVCVR